ncbi:MAG: class I SAM-dependent methyltransferase [Candidatus Acetothermia bacterium]
MSFPPLSFLIFFLVVALLSWLSWNATLDAWWQPTDHNTVTKMLEMLDLEPGEVVYDLGCGDGRFLTKAVRDFELEAVGIEIDPLRVFVSKLRVLLGGARSEARVLHGDMYEKKLSEADGVLLFLSGDANEKLAPKFEDELVSGVRIVSYYHELPGWEPAREEKNEKGHPVYLYEVEN